mmetsp:Transcript_12851/g.18496  ORF Transcript_12851/g.18496 Transcript_12851/m.18496 type:complete len:225 (-) Transcript_12851:894-1568(-)
MNSPAMLTHLLEQVTNHANVQDVNVETGHEYKSIQEMVQDAKSMGCDGVVNCTGLASSKLNNDSDLVGARGILLLFDRTTTKRTFKGPNEAEGEGVLLHDAAIFADQPPWGSDAEPCYLIPRGDKLVVGGSYLEGDTHGEIRPTERARLLKYAETVGIDTTATPPVGEWVGFRPYRATCKCELDPNAGKNEGISVVHSYGHGGSGWTVHVGVAKDVADILVQDL